MHIKQEKPHKRASVRDGGPRHMFAGGKKYQPKHAMDTVKQPNGIGVFVVAVLFLAAVIVLHEYAFLMLPASIVSLVLSILAVSRRATGFSVTAVVISAILAVFTASFTVMTIIEYITGTSMSVFTIFS